MHVSSTCRRMCSRNMMGISPISYVGVIIMKTMKETICTTTAGKIKLFFFYYLNIMKTNLFILIK